MADDLLEFSGYRISVYRHSGRCSSGNVVCLDNYLAAGIILKFEVPGSGFGYQGLWNFGPLKELLFRYDMRLVIFLLSTVVRSIISSKMSSFMSPKS